MARRHGLREAARRRGAAPSRVHPGPLDRAEPDPVALAVHGLDGARPRRPDPDPVELHRARRDRRDAGGPDRPAAPLQLLPDRRRQRRPEPRVPQPARRLDDPGDDPDREQPGAAQRERDLRPPDARPRHPRQGDRAPDGGHRPEPAGERRSPRLPAGPPVQRLPGARVRHPDPRRGRLPGPLPGPDRRDQAEPPDHRPVPPQHARRADHGQAAAPPPAAAGPGVRRHRGARAASTPPTSSATARTSRSGCGSTTRRSSISSRSAS